MTLPVCSALYGTHAGEKDMETMLGARKMDTLFGAGQIERLGFDASRLRGAVRYVLRLGVEQQ